MKKMMKAFLTAAAILLAAAQPAAALDLEEAIDAFNGTTKAGRAARDTFETIKEVWRDSEDLYCYGSESGNFSSEKCAAMREYEATRGQEAINDFESYRDRQRRAEERAFDHNEDTYYRGLGDKDYANQTDSRYDRQRVSADSYGRPQPKAQPQAQQGYQGYPNYGGSYGGGYQQPTATGGWGNY